MLTRGGCPAGKARSFFGLMLKEHGLSVALQALASTEAAAPVDARGYLRGECERLAAKPAAPARPIPDADETAEAQRRQQLTPEERQAAEAARLKAVAVMREMREARGLGPPGA